MLGGVWAQAWPGHRVGINRKLFRDTTCINTSGKLHAEQEPDNLVDEFAMKLVNNNETVGHLRREYSRILWYYIARSRKIRVAVTGCRRLFVRVKRKLIA